MLSLPHPHVPADVLASHGAVAGGLLLALLAARAVPLLYALLLWPGTLAHELAHYLAGLLLGAQPVMLEVWPRRLGAGRWQLGEVRFARLRWWNKVPVGLAPLALLPLGAWLFWLALAWLALSWRAVALSLLAAQFVLAAWPSGEDLRHVLVGLLALVALAFAVAALRVGWRMLAGLT